MRIDASQILAQGGVKVKSGADSITSSLKEGDIIKAEVLASDKGSVFMKTEAGQAFKAKLEAQVALAPGDKVLLEVTGKDKGLVLLSAGDRDEMSDESSWQPGQARDTSDKGLTPYLNKLAEMNMPVNESAARVMRALLAQNPAMRPEEAAFLASNKLTGDESLMRAALALLSSGEKTDAMIARLLALLSMAESGGGATELQPAARETRPAGPDGLSVIDSLPPDTGSTDNSGFRIPDSGLPNPAALQSAALTDLLNQILNGSADAGGLSGHGNITPSPNLPTIIAQNDVIMQSTNVEKVQEYIQNGDNLLELEDLMSKNPPDQISQIPDSGASGAETGALGQAVAAAEAMPGILPETLPGPLPGPLPGAAESAPKGAPPPAAAGSAFPDNPEPGTVHSESAKPDSPSSTLHTNLSAILSTIPEFHGTPPQALERFSGMLLRVAGESGEMGSDIEKLQAQIDKLFTRIGKGDPDAGARLRQAKAELYTRLALIEETISRAAPPARAEMQGQTQRLMEHVRLLNSIDQFAYMQLPVQLGEERKTAELYLFRRKGNRKPDPENVNILLALDLEHMGRWEALLNIRKKDVSIQMEVRGEREKAHFSENTMMLHEMLAEAGFKLVNTAITNSEKETTPLTALSTLERYTAGRSGLIDFWI